MGGRHLPGTPSRLQGQQGLGLHFGQEAQCPLLGLQDRAPQGSPENRGEGSRIIAVVVILIYWGFPGGAVVKNLPANAGDKGSSPALGRSHMPRSN